VCELRAERTRLEMKLIMARVAVDGGSLLPAVNFYRSCVGLGWLAQETTGFILVRASKE
jgi:hypothetical protein